ncbi:hypothetical protein [Oceanobacillus saliphilus]|uniref:hypothetical protein n=1 Tax=Oceanobacillus saliphilus TaxID=2925834 RepID=UPI00201E39B5|nr:hypothetical protein [Oceanobacillus saliphilus]
MLVFTISSNIVPKSRLGEGIVFFAMSTSVGTTIRPPIAISYLAKFSFESMMMLTLGLMSFSLLCSFFTKNTKVEKEKEGPQTNNDEPIYKYMFVKACPSPLYTGSI